MTNQYGERQQQQELRSINNYTSSFVRFVNVTRNNVNVYWMDYSGKPIFYKTLGCQEYIDINTFVTHPWIFVDKETKDRYLVNGRSVYFPQPWYILFQGSSRIRVALSSRAERIIVKISLPLYTLRDMCLRVIKRRLRSDRSAYDLELPRMLQRELYYLKPRKTAMTRSDMQEMLEETREARGNRNNDTNDE